MVISSDKTVVDTVTDIENAAKNKQSGVIAELAGIIKSLGSLAIILIVGGLVVVGVFVFIFVFFFFFKGSSK